jgi:hypothetical protein
VQWSYDLLDDIEKGLLTRCSVFAGGFDLAAACAVTAADDELSTLDLLDALVRKSLLVADRTSGRTRFSMLETIRQFAEEQLALADGGDTTRTAHARHFARRQADVFAVWDSRRQREAYDWFTRELANLRTAFRWSADHDDFDTAAAIAVNATFLGYMVEQWEPIGWAEELIPHAEAVQHPRLAQLYVGASYCAAVGRANDFVGYAKAAGAAIASGQFDDVNEALECAVAVGYNTTGRPDLAVEWCRATIARNPGIATHAAQSVMVVAMTVTGRTDEAIEASSNLPAIAHAADNPALAGAMLLAYGWARRHTDPTAAYDALRQAWTTAEESNNRQQASITAGLLSGLAAARGEFTDAFDYITQTTRHYYDSGAVELMRVTLGTLLVALLDRLGHHEPAATISGFAADALARASFPEIDDAVAHLREVLGGDGYAARAEAGANMTNAERATYAFDQIDRARAELA